MTDDHPETITGPTGRSTPLAPHTSPVTCDFRMRNPQWDCCPFTAGDGELVGVGRPADVPVSRLGIWLHVDEDGPVAAGATVHAIDPGTTSRAGRAGTGDENPARAAGATIAADATGASVTATATGAEGVAVDGDGSATAPAGATTAAGATATAGSARTALLV